MSVQTTHCDSDVIELSDEELTNVVGGEIVIPELQVSPPPPQNSGWFSRLSSRLGGGTCH